MEIWKDVIGYEEFYQISNRGNIRSKDREFERPYQETTRIYRRKGKLLKPYPSPRGYLLIDLRSKTTQVHRLVAEHFISNPNDKSQVNHKDNVKTNNHVDNLEWVTHQENVAHAQQFRSYDYLKKPIAQIDIQSGDTVKIWDSTADAKRAGYGSTDRVANGHLKTCGGYYWKYV